MTPDNDYPYNEMFISEVRPRNHHAQLREIDAYLTDVSPMLTAPIIPAQQTYVMEIETTHGTEYLYMGDLWGSAPDNIKGHDQQYWSPPLKFDAAGNIERMEWVEEWYLWLPEK